MVKSGFQGKTGGAGTATPPSGGSASIKAVLNIAFHQTNIAVRKLEECERRIQDLLEANNRYLERARDAECALATIREATDGQTKQLKDALRAMTQRYVDLANSGDAGFWDPEGVPEVIAARAALEAKP